MHSIAFYNIVTWVTGDRPDQTNQQLQGGRVGNFACARMEEAAQDPQGRWQDSSPHVPREHPHQHLQHHHGPGEGEDQTGGWKGWSLGLLGLRGLSLYVFFIVFYCVSLYCIALYRLALYCISLHCIVLRYVVFHCIVLYCTIIIRIILAV